MSLTVTDSGPLVDAAVTSAARMRARWYSYWVRSVWRVRTTGASSALPPGVISQGVEGSKWFLWQGRRFVDGQSCNATAGGEPAATYPGAARIAPAPPAQVAS